ncbi:hypothetical protein BH09MYX1_BH09MYX1_28970 [soil metagenome]
MAAFACALLLSAACGGGGCHTSISKSWDASYNVSYGGAVDASALTTPTATAPSISDAGSATATASVTPSSSSVATLLPPKLRGVFHSDMGPDERNLVIDGDGTFFWEIFGCDFGGGDCGVWRNTGTTVVLTPRPPATSMSWATPPEVTGKVVKIVLSEHGGNLEAHGTTALGKTFVQLWYPGQICAPCGDSLGPSGKLYACTRPLTKSCP